MKIDSLKLIEELSNANGISGFEEEVLTVIKKYVSDNFNIKEDSLKNMQIHRKDYNESKPTIMIDGHSDEIGFMVQSIKSNGTLKFITIGGWFSQNIPAHKVKIKNKQDKYIAGIVASKPPHFMKKEEKNKIVKTDQMVIDIGASSKDEVINKYKIDLGAPIIPDAKFEYNQNNNLMLGKAFDNRLGCAGVIDVMTKLNNKSLNFNLVGSISAQEEVGTRGIEVNARNIKPDLAVVLEGTPGDDTFKDKSDAQAVLHKGPQIRHRDSTLIANPRFVKFARNTAQRKGIPFQDAVRTGGGTNAGKITLSNSGVPTIVLGVPVRYAHTHYGYSSYSDYKNTVRWCIEILRRLTPDAINGF